MVAKYRIQIRELTPADVNTACDVQFAAFENNVMNDLMYPGGLNDAAKTKSRERLLAALTGEVDKKKGKAFIYVAEYWPADSPADAPGEIVAMARWALHAEPRTEEEYKGEEFNPTAEMFGDGANLEFIKVFVGGLNGKTSEHIKGEPYLHLHILACRPDRQGLGAGSALLKWGADLADSLGLPALLESSPVGYPLYRRFGFEDIDVLDIDVTGDWGVSNSRGENWGEKNAVALAGPVREGVMRSVIMRRPAKKVAA